MPIAEGATDTASLLPADKSFGDLLWPYLTPYLVFVSIASLPESLLSPEWSQVFKLIATTALLLWFRGTYRFGVFRPGHLLVSLMALPVALFCWIAPFYLLRAVGVVDTIGTGGGEGVSPLIFYLRLLNSVILVAIFEELLIRVYVVGWLHQAGLQRQEKGLFASIVDTLDQHPQSLSALPLSPFAVIGATIVFAAGHQIHEYLSAVLYFLFTTWLFKKTGSLWVCILIHGLTNLGIALLVRYGGMEWLWG